MDPELSRQLYETFAAAVAYINVEEPDGKQGIGSAFHVGDGVFITARHVIENVKILEISTTERAYVTKAVHPEHGVREATISFWPGKLNIVKGPFFHPNPNIDVAAFVVDRTDIPEILLGDHLDDWLGTELVLQPALVLGYPPIPLSWGPLLIATVAEVNAIVDMYAKEHPHFILSTMARGGFSGGVAITTYGCALGVITQSLTTNNQPAELGYLAVLTVEPIFVCLGHHKIMPQKMRARWLFEGDTETMWERNEDNPKV